jgi:hypothetical protein
MPLLAGGCACGRVRFAVDRYLYVLACHCNACKKRTGSAYGVSVVIDDADVREFEGATKTFIRKAESGHDVRYEFCPGCATTVRWRVAALPDRQVFACGAFDDTRSFRIAGEMYTDAALSWSRIGCALVRPGPADDAFRGAMIAFAQSAH